MFFGFAKGAFAETDGDENPHFHRRRIDWLIVGVIAMAIALQVAFWVRQGIGGDQRALLGLGAKYAESGVLESSAKQTSGGGHVPGVLLSYAIGLPLRVWASPKAPGVPLIFANALALVLLAITLRRLAGSMIALFFLALYALSPWRLYNGGILWEPAYLFLPAAMHFAACAALRKRARVVASLALGASVALAFQFHASFLVLAIAAGILLIRKDIRLNWPSAAAGALLAGAPFLASCLAPGNERSLAFAPHYSGNGWSVVLTIVANTPKAFFYWLQMGSAYLGRLGSIVLPSQLTGVIVVLTSATVLLPLAAAARAWRTLRPRGARADGPGAAGPSSPATHLREGRVGWMLRYALAMLMALMLSAALSPVSLQNWHTTVAMHAACIPPALLLAEMWSGKRRGSRLLVAAFLGLVVAATIVILTWLPLFAGAARMHG
jgi:hypothetical protein